MCRNRSIRAQKINAFLAREYPDARCELIFEDPWELLVATILSAQSTDARVNTVTPVLFDVYPDPFSTAKASADVLAAIIRPCGMQNTKARAIIGSGKMIVEKYGGCVPHTREELMALPGVGRKTANVVLGEAFHIPGITVDTHVGRVTRRMGIVSVEQPRAVERELEELIPREEWTNFCHRIIFHGRRRCHSRTPECAKCCVRCLCDFATKTS